MDSEYARSAEIVGALAGTLSGSRLHGAKKIGYGNPGSGSLKWVSLQWHLFTPTRIVVDQLGESAFTQLLKRHQSGAQPGIELIGKRQ